MQSLLYVQSLLYWPFGMFANYQVLRIVSVTTPEVLGTYGAAARKVFGIGITAMLGILLVMLWSTMMWLSVALGSVVSRLPGLMPRTRSTSGRAASAGQARQA
jgi:hypothetical protein